MGRNSENYQSFPEVKWNFADVLLVSIAILLLAIGGAIALILLFQKGPTAFKVYLCAGAVVTGLFPILWLQRRYKQSVEALGLRRGRLGVLVSVFVGIAAAVIYTAVAWPTLYGESLDHVRRVAFYPLRYYLHILLTITGLSFLVLGPVSEEILFRGFVYGYLRIRLSVVGGLAVQASVFSLFHLGMPEGHHGVLVPTIARFIIGLLLGLLYEMTGSLFPSMACHSVINYFAILFSLVR